MAGIYARSDSERGVHKAPRTRSFAGALGLQVLHLARGAGLLEPARINCIRNMGDRGIRVWGARTVSSVRRGGTSTSAVCS